MNKIHEVEYEEAPSGYVTFYNYKEPLMKFDSGYGFVGALVFDGKSDKIQCHFCGQWFEQLGNHIKKEHAINAEQYKTRVGLNKTTALINEKYRAKLIANGLKLRIKNLQNMKGRTRSLETRRKIAETLRENRDEQKNLRGTCPEQLLERYNNLWQKLGRTPKVKEITFYEALIKTYGSMKRVSELTGIPYRKVGETEKKTKFTEDFCINWVREFFDKNNRLPKAMEMGESIRAKINKYGKKSIFRQALKLDGRYRKINEIIRYSKEELIEFLIAFEKREVRKPSYSDCKRGLLPNLSRYSYNFGSWKNALKIAFKQ